MALSDSESLRLLLSTPPRAPLSFLPTSLLKTFPAEMEDVLKTPLATACVEDESGHLTIERRGGGGKL